jgi:hypothetical protein
MTITTRALTTINRGRYTVEIHVHSEGHYGGSVFANTPQKFASDLVAGDQLRWGTVTEVSRTEDEVAVTVNGEVYGLHPLTFITLAEPQREWLASFSADSYEEALLEAGGAIRYHVGQRVANELF